MSASSSSLPTQMVTISATIDSKPAILRALPEPLSFERLKTEFGLSDSHEITSRRRNGAFVKIDSDFSLRFLAKEYIGDELNIEVREQKQELPSTEDANSGEPPRKRQKLTQLEGGLSKSSISRSSLVQVSGETVSVNIYQRRCDLLSEARKKGEAIVASRKSNKSSCQLSSYKVLMNELSEEPLETTKVIMLLIWLRCLYRRQLEPSIESTAFVRRVSEAQSKDTICREIQQAIMNRLIPPWSTTMVKAKRDKLVQRIQQIKKAGDEVDLSFGSKPMGNWTLGDFSSFFLLSGWRPCLEECVVSGELSAFVEKLIEHVVDGGQISRVGEMQFSNLLAEAQVEVEKPEQAFRRFCRLRDLFGEGSSCIVCLHPVYYGDAKAILDCCGRSEMHSTCLLKSRRNGKVQCPLCRKERNER